MQQNNQTEMSADNKRESLKTWLSIAEDAICSTMEKLEEYKQEYGEHGEIEAMLYDHLMTALGEIQDAQGEERRLPE